MTQIHMTPDDFPRPHVCYKCSLGAHERCYTPEWEPPCECSCRDLGRKYMEAMTASRTLSAEDEEAIVHLLKRRVKKNEDHSGSQGFPG